MYLHLVFPLSVLLPFDIFTFSFPLSQACDPLLMWLQQLGPHHSLPARAPANSAQWSARAASSLGGGIPPSPWLAGKTRGRVGFCIISGHQGCSMVSIITSQATKHLEDRVPAPQDPASARCWAGRAAWHDTRKGSPVDRMFSQA